MDFFVPKFIKYQLYLLQLENYELGRYFKLLWARGFWPNKHQPQRKDLVWTAKAKALLLMAVALHVLIVIFAGFIAVSMRAGNDWLLSFLIIALLVCLPFYFLWFSLALVLISPLDVLAKKRIVVQAKSKISNLKSQIIIIGIAGSYGKTTMKEVLGEVLGARFKMLVTPESVNTPVGIARWILKNFNPTIGLSEKTLTRPSDGHPLPLGEGNTEVAIIEMGEHYAGDVKEICDIVKPDIAVITGINESHLERMKSMDTVVATVFELVSNSKQGATVMLNANDDLVMQNYQSFVWPDHRIERFSAEGGSASGGKIERYKVEDLRLRNFNAEKLVWECEADSLGKIEINLLGEYALGDVSAAIKIARNLGLSNEDIKRGIANIKPVEHRLQPIQPAGGVLIIDDSYNGNPQGVKEAIKVLGRFSAKGGSASGGKNHRKVYITPGLVEMGNAAADIHRDIGKQLATVADVVVLIKNSVTPYIAEAIDQDLTVVVGRQDRVKPKIIWFNSAPEAHAGLKSILKPGDVIIFQNDWGDQYF